MRPVYLGAYVSLGGNLQIITDTWVKKNHSIPPHRCLKLGPILWCNSCCRGPCGMRLKVVSSLHPYSALFSCLILLPSLSFPKSTLSINYLAKDLCLELCLLAAWPKTRNRGEAGRQNDERRDLFLPPSLPFLSVSAQRWPLILCYELNCVPVIDVKVLTPSTSECGLNWK